MQKNLYVLKFVQYFLHGLYAKYFFFFLEWNVTWNDFKFHSYTDSLQTLHWSTLLCISHSIGTNSQLHVFYNQTHTNTHTHNICCTREKLWRWRWTLHFTPSSLENPTRTNSTVNVSIRKQTHFTSITIFCNVNFIGLNVLWSVLMET